MEWGEIFYYDESSPSWLRWKVDRYSGKNNYIKHISKGDVAGTLDSKGHYRVSVNMKTVGAHRIIWELFNGPTPSGYVIDHMDGDRTNNNLLNLRAVTPEVNCRNLKKYSSNSSGVTGVSLLSNKTSKGANQYWSAKWNEDGKQKNKRFSVTKYGFQEAYELACDFRNGIIASLIDAGAGYSDRHGC